MVLMQVREDQRVDLLSPGILQPGPGRLSGAVQGTEIRVYRICFLRGKRPHKRILHFVSGNTICIRPGKSSGCQRLFRNHPPPADDRTVPPSHLPGYTD